MNKYQLYCNTESSWKVALAESTPLCCPNSPDDEIRVDSVAIVPELTLDEAKQIKISEIDSKTRILISQGFIFDSNSFSLSERAQSNWISLKALETNLTWPIKLSTKDDTSYSLAQSDLSAFVDAFLSARDAALESGRQLKVSISDCSTEDEVEQIEDNR